MLVVSIGFKGDQSDPRMREASNRRGVVVTSISRKIRPSDFKDFDIILAMDKQNRGSQIELISFAISVGEFECLFDGDYLFRDWMLLKYRISISVNRCGHINVSPYYYTPIHKELWFYFLGDCLDAIMLTIKV